MGSCFIYVNCVCVRTEVSNTYCVVILLCLSSSCVHYVASFFGFFIFDFHFGITFIYKPDNQTESFFCLISVVYPTATVVCSIMTGTRTLFVLCHHVACTCEADGSMQC